MKQHSKLDQKQEQVVEQQTQQQAAREFENSDELLRFDAAQTTVPPEIAERLKRTTRSVSPPKAGWFKRLFN